jgi:hypothetical protein
MSKRRSQVVLRLLGSSRLHMPLAFRWSWLGRTPLPILHGPSTKTFVKRDARLLTKLSTDSPALWAGIDKGVPSRAGPPRGTWPFTNFLLHLYRHKHGNGVDCCNLLKWKDLDCASWGTVETPARDVFACHGILCVSWT